jgi:hypothetical protein
MEALPKNFFKSPNLNLKTEKDKFTCSLFLQKNETAKESLLTA